MIANRELGIEDYLAIVRRRLILLLIPTLVAALVGFLISFALTPKYTSRSELMVEEQVVPDGYVKPIVTGTVSDRMITLQQSVLNRTRLEPLVTSLGLVRKGKSADDVIDQIRDNVSVSAKKGPPGSTGPAGFVVSYTADNPRDAQQVCAEVTSLVLAENLELREQAAKSTTDFLSRQLEQAKHNLDEMDAKLSEFKIQHFGRMPGDIESGLRIMAGMNAELDSSSQTLNRLQLDKSNAETMLEKVLEAKKAAEASPTYGSLRQQLIKLESQLVLLQTRYTEDFPDVVKTEHEIEQLQAKLREINDVADTSDVYRDATVPREGAKLEPPEIMRLREQIRHDDLAFEHVTERQKRLQAQIDLYQSRFALNPEIEEEYKQLTRDNGTAHNLYDQLLINKSTAEIQTEMERNQEGERLKLLDPATLPNSPSFPVRWKFALYGLGGGFGIGLSIALLLEFQDKAIRNEGDVLAALELPMLGSVPWVGAAANGKKLPRGPFISRLEEERTAEV